MIILQQGVFRLRSAIMMNKEQNKKLNNNSRVLVASIFALAGPTMLEQLLQTAVQYIDTAMVGSLGTEATAAVGSTTTVNWLIGSSISAFGVGFLAYISQAYGAGRMDKVRKASGQATFMVLFVGLFFTGLTLAVSPYVPAWMQVDPNIRKLASEYFFILYLPMLFRTASMIFGTVLRAAGDTKTPMKVGIIVNLTNVVLNTLLIFETKQWEFSYGMEKAWKFTLPGAGLGVIGAAIASAIAFTVGGLLTFLAVLRHKDLSPRGVSILPDREVLMPCMKVALPNMLQRFCTSLGYVFFAAMINSLGEVSTAAHTIANTVESAFYIPGYGMMTAAATLTGNAIGAHDRKKQQETSRAIILIEVSMMIFSGGLLFVFAPQMTSLFTHSQEVIRLCSTVLRMVAVSEPFYGISIVIEGMLQGAGETVRPFRYSVSSMWGVRILGTFICINLLHMGLVSAWACMIGNNLLLCALFVLDWKKYGQKLVQ